METEINRTFHIKDCQAEMLLTRKYRPEDESIIYTCRNNRNMCVAADNIDADRILEIDKKALYSIRTQECFKCPYLHQ